MNSLTQQRLKKVQKLMKLFKLEPVEDAQWHEKNTVQKKT